ncbi:Minor extracellular protease vpr, partial [Choanephora cucurbitarum]
SNHLSIISQRPLLCLFLLLNICSTIYVNAKSTTHTQVNYILEFPSAQHTNDFIDKNLKSNNIARVRNTYHSDLFNGAAVEFSSLDVANDILSSLSNAVAWPIRYHNSPTTPKEVDNTTEIPTRFVPESKNTIKALTEANNKYRNLKSNGSGIKIGIIDSGIDYKHPALGGCFGKGCKVAYGYDLVGNEFNGLPSTIKESEDPIDNCPQNSTSATGHGTFIAGIIAADDKAYNWHGVAPGVTLGAWRVYGCYSSSAPNDIILKAMEMAYKAGMDIITISLGVGGAWDENVLSVMADRIVSKGVHVVAASGNSGTGGVFLTASPGSGEKVLTVGSTQNAHVPGYLLELTNPKYSVPYRTYVNSPFTLNSSLPIVASGKKFNQKNDACSKLKNKKKYKDSIVLIHQGDCNPLTKVTHAYEAGASAVVLYTDIQKTATSFEVLQHAMLPVAYVNNDDGHKLFKTISKKRNTKASFTNKLVALKASTSQAGTVSSFSSLGPTYELQLKPEITAIGDTVFSTLPRYLKSYGFGSGTSYSTPYVAGSLGLLLANTRKDLSPEMAKQTLMNFAQPVKTPISDSQYGDSPIRQGAGVVDVAQAIAGYQQFHVTPAKLSFNDSAHFDSQKHTITIHNHHSHKTLTFHINHDPSLTVLGFSTEHNSSAPSEPIGLYNHNNSVAAISFSKTTVTVPAGKSIDVKLQIKPPTDTFKPSLHAIYGGFVSVTTGNLKANVPYIGMIGNMFDLPILDRQAKSTSYAPFPFPSIGLSDGKTTLTGNQTVHVEIKHNKDKTFGSGGVFILARLLTGTPVLQFQVLNAKTNKIIGDIPMSSDSTPRKWMSRNTISITESSSVYYSWYWSGEYVPRDSTLTSVKQKKVKIVKSGQYRIKIRALRVFGNPEQKNDWEEWLSPKLILSMSNDQ